MRYTYPLMFEKCIERNASNSHIPAQQVQLLRATGNYQHESLTQGGMADYAMFHSQLLLLDYQFYKKSRTEKVAITEIGRQCIFALT